MAGIDTLVELAAPEGIAGWAGFALIVTAASLVSEDLACIGVGLLVGDGRVGFVEGAAVAGAALLVGDLGLYAAGRLASAPWGRVLRRRRLFQRAAARAGPRASRAGPALVFTSRFLPGARLPTYLGAGLARLPARRFLPPLAAAIALWAPLLVGAAALTGAVVVEAFSGYARAALPAALLLAALLFGVTRGAAALADPLQRRRALGALRRWRRFEYWPLWLFYAPVVVWIALLALRHRSLLVVTAANHPAIEGGGLAGESKQRILEAMGSVPEVLPRTRLLPAEASFEARLAAARAFRAERPEGAVVLKPDRGERGRHVEVVRDDVALRAYLARSRFDVLVQEYVPGLEVGILWARAPGAARGRILSIVEKRLPELVGDGRRTLEELILFDERGVCQAADLARADAARLGQVPAAGERVRLVEIGTHSRGALFLDGRRLRTPALEAEIERIAGAIAGFDLGRFDLRAPDEAALRAGRGLRVLELNGITAEPGHIYDPRHGLLAAWCALCAQWRLAYAIGAARRRAGVRPLTLRQAIALLRLRPDAEGRVRAESAPPMG